MTDSAPGGPDATSAPRRPHGTVVMPTHTPENSDPAGWRNPPVPEDWWPVIRAEMPGYDPALTPSRFMGALAAVEFAVGWLARNRRTEEA